MQIHRNDRALSFGVRDMMEEDAGKDNQRTGDRIHLKVIVENNRRAILLGLEIQHARKVSREMGVTYRVVRALVNCTPTVPDFEAHYCRVDIPVRLGSSRASVLHEVANRS